MFRVPCSLVKNGISVNLLALPDSGAMVSVFLIAVYLLKYVNY